MSPTSPFFAQPVQPVPLHAPQPGHAPLPSHNPVFAPPASLPPPADPRTAMSLHEAKWHAHTAGVRAMTAAQQTGYDHLRAETIVGGAAGPVTIANLLIQPPSPGALVCLQRLVRMRRQRPDAAPQPAPKADWEHLVASAFVFIRTVEAWQLLDRGLTEFEVAAFQFGCGISFDDLRQINAWIEAELGKFAGNDDEADPQAAASEAVAQPPSKTSPTEPTPSDGSPV